MTQLATQTPAVDYHDRHDAVSHSMLEVFRRSAALDHGRFIAKTIPHPEPTPAMELGSAVHAAILEPERYAEGWIVAPSCDRRTKDGKAVWAAFVEGSAGKHVVSQDDSEKVQAIANAVRSHRVAGRLVDRDGPVEQAIFWESPCGRQMRAKPDKVILTSDIVIDIKTAADPCPEEFARAVDRYGYHRQAALYQRGLYATYRQNYQFIFIVVGSSPPHDVLVCELDNDALEFGNRQNDSDLKKLRRCEESGEWVSEWARDVRCVSLPRYAMQREEWEIE